jgi:uncharacterized membrane protein YcaP (DUF421 family)
LETNGDLSVFLYPSERPATAKEAGFRPEAQQLPVTIIDDGRLLKQNLNVAGKNEDWVNRVLTGQNATLDGTFLLTVDAADHILWLPKEGRK